MISTNVIQDWPSNGDSGLLAAIRQIVREEIRQALADEIDADAARPEPRIVTVAHLTDEGAAYYVAARTEAKQQ